MRTHAHVDWLAITFPSETPLNSALPAEITSVPFSKDGNPSLGYSVVRLNDNGARVMTGGTPAQGMHIVLPADALLAARAEGLTDKALCAQVVDNGGRATRIDFAVDILDCVLTVSDLRAAYLAGEIETAARAATQISKLNTPEDTLYLGSRRSDRFFRAYNKGAQVKSEDCWLRLELECKRLVAAGYTHGIAANDDTRQTINAAIRAYADFPKLPLYQQALADHDAHLPRVPRKIHATYRWLIEQVAPALAKFQFEHPDEPVEEAFLTAWHIAYDRIVLYSHTHPDVD